MHLLNNTRPSLPLLLGLTVYAFLAPAPVLSETPIGNGKLFLCEGSTILSARTGSEVAPAKALGKFKRIVRKQKQRIASLAKGSKKRARAIAARKAARNGLKDVRSCRNGELGSNNLLAGDWNLLTENGKTPMESNFNFLTLTFSGNTFVSEFDGNSIDCHWEGTYTSSNDPATATLLTLVGTGGASCEQAINQERTAAVSFTEDGNTLTLDYRPEGTLQVFERVS